MDCVHLHIVRCFVGNMTCVVLETFLVTSGVCVLVRMRRRALVVRLPNKPVTYTKHLFV